MSSLSVNLPRCNVVWLRRDLRLQDNDALWQATMDSNVPTLCIFAVDPWFFKQPEVGSARVSFLIESLDSFDKNIKSKGGVFRVYEGNSAKTVTEVLSQLSKKYSPKLFFNRDMQVVYGRERDRAVEDYCQQNSVPVYKGYRSFLQLEDNYDSWIGSYYKYQESDMHPIPSRVRPIDNCDQIITVPSVPIQEIKVWSSALGVKPSSSDMFVGGERQAHQLLQSFAGSRYKGYHWKVSRPFLAQNGATSHLSPHIVFGTISTRSINQTMYTFKQTLKDNNPKGALSVAAFLDRLRWCDSFSQRLWHHPEIAWKNRFPEFDELYQDAELDEQSELLFAAWKNGTTGFPLLDASMRQLRYDGWMNFRMRAQAATTLTIIFGVSWHHGARYFMQKLVDGDIAINHWQWQMQAGITNPLQATLRIYNPDKNIATKDPQLQYIHHWLPELRKHKTIDDVLAASHPIVDYAQARKTGGAKVNEIRKRVRTRILKEKGIDLQSSAQAQRTVIKYNQRTEARYAAHSQQQSLLFEEGNA